MLANTSPDNTIRFDKKEGNILWSAVINKEMKNARIAFELLERDETPSVV